MSDMLERRTQPLEDASVLLIMGSIDKRNTYQFLAFAAGAGRVRTAHSLAEAKKLVEAGSTFDYVLFDGDKSKAKDALAPLAKQEVGRKRRKRESDGNISAGAKISESEFLVQTLILGSLVAI